MRTRSGDLKRTIIDVNLLLGFCAPIVSGLGRTSRTPQISEHEEREVMLLKWRKTYIEYLIRH